MESSKTIETGNNLLSMVAAIVALLGVAAAGVGAWFNLNNSAAANADNIEALRAKNEFLEVRLNDYATKSFVKNEVEKLTLGSEGDTNSVLQKLQYMEAKQSEMQETSKALRQEIRGLSKEMASLVVEVQKIKVTLEAKDSGTTG